MIAALYVARGGCYYGLPDVERWGLPDRDAREYAGPWPVVAHPPCKFWSVVNVARLGCDDGSFRHALECVRRFGGVLEQPARSRAWVAHGLLASEPNRGWQPAGDWIGWVCQVEQGHYGHRARKATWLYAAGVDLPELRWEESTAQIGPRPGRDPKREQRIGAVQRMGHKERDATPLPFRDLLLSIARTARLAPRPAEKGSVA